MRVSIIFFFSFYFFWTIKFNIFGLLFGKALSNTECFSSYIPLTSPSEIQYKYYRFKVIIFKVTKNLKI